jgi:hypothetical protein
MSRASLTNPASTATGGDVASQAAVIVLSKALSSQQQSATTLLQSLPNYSNPANLGNVVDVKA